MHIYWAAGDVFLPMDNFDFSGWTLQTLDGTQYTISRDDQGWQYLANGSVVHAFGDAHLSQIIERTGDTITIGPSGIAHYAGGTNLTKSVFFQRNAQGLISAIYDPMKGS